MRNSITVTPTGTPTTELENYKLSLRPFRELYGHTPACDFGPLALKAVRQRMISLGWCRTAINGRIGRIQRMFKWAASEELIPVTVFHSLGTVAGLQAGRSEAVEREAVKPIPEAIVETMLPFLNRHVAGLVQFQRFWCLVRASRAFTLPAVVMAFAMNAASVSDAQRPPRITERQLSSRHASFAVSRRPQARSGKHDLLNRER